MTYQKTFSLSRSSLNPLRLIIASRWKTWPRSKILISLNLCHRAYHNKLFFNNNNNNNNNNCYSNSNYNNNNNSNNNCSSNSNYTIILKAPTISKATMLQTSPLQDSPIQSCITSSSSKDPTINSSSSIPNNLLKTTCIATLRPTHSSSYNSNSSSMVASTHKTWEAKDPWSIKSTSRTLKVL